VKTESRSTKNISDSEFVQKRSERLKVGARSAAVLKYGEHRSAEIESRSSL